MKLHTLILGAAALSFGAGAFAQSVTFHAGIDYTTWGVTQTRLNTDGEKENTDASAGYDPDGSMTVDVSVHAANFEFNLGVSYNADGGDGDYYDFSDKLNNSFYQGHMKVSFLNEQAALYLGKFEDFNGDFIADGYALGGQYITNLADSDYGQYLTGLMISPIPLSGFRMFVGFPILPQNGNGIPDGDYDKWSILYKKAKIAASYELPNSFSINAGWRPGTYFDGVDDADSGTMAGLTDKFTESMFGEAYLQFLMPNIVEGVSANVSYDLRYRDNAYYKKIDGTKKEHTALAHMVGASAEFGSILSDALTFAVEDRFFFAGDDYITSDEKFMYDILGVAVEYAVGGKPFSIGLNCAGMSGADAQGTSLADDGGAKITTGNYYCSGDIGMSLNDMDTASLSGLSGKATTYIGFYANPYIKFNMSNGALTIGAEVCYTNFSNDDVTNTGLSYRVPVGLKFEF